MAVSCAPGPEPRAHQGQVGASGCCAGDGAPSVPSRAEPCEEHIAKCKSAASASGAKTAVALSQGWPASIEATSMTSKARKLRSGDRMGMRGSQSPVPVNRT